MIKEILKTEVVPNKQGKRLTRTTFLCSCGKTHSAWQKDINYGSVQSCGCAVKANHHKTHGMVGTKTYRAWVNMKRRCDDSNAPYYKNYGGRGIEYDQRWRDFNKFYEDMGEAPEGMSLDRIDNETSYCKVNCRWASGKTQHNNKRTNRVVTYKRKKYTLSELAQHVRMNPKTLWVRLQRGATVAEAVEKPVIMRG